MPEHVEFQESWRIALDLLDRSQKDLPFAWVAGDDEYGRASEFRAGLRFRHLHYVVDIPSNIVVRPLASKTWTNVAELAKKQPSSSWRKIALGPGSKGPKVVRALRLKVQKPDDEGRPGTVEELVVIRTVDGESQTWYTLARGPDETPLEKFMWFVILETDRSKKKYASNDGAPDAGIVRPFAPPPTSDLPADRRGDQRGPAP